MNDDQNIEIYSPSRITSAIEVFGEELHGFLERMGLPKEDVLVPLERRTPVFQNAPTALDSLDDQQKSESVYVSKFMAACAIGLFDAALNYLWNETVRKLREKVAQFDLAYFLDSAVNDSKRRAKLDTDADLTELSDWELVNGCQKTGIITEDGFLHLDTIRNMRNHASAAHPNQNELTGLLLIAWLEKCILDVFSKNPGGPVVEVRKLLNNLRKERLTSAEVPHIADGLSSLPPSLSDSLLRSILGMYTDPGVNSQVKDNIKLVAKPVWKVASESSRQEAGLKQATLAANGDVSRSNLAREFIEIVGGVEYLSDTILSGEMSTALDSLMTAHHGWDNFHTEPAPARLLHHLAIGTNEIPKSVTAKYVKSLVMCRIGNGRGVSWDAEGYYDELIGRFSDQHIQAFINLVDDPEVASRLRFPCCATKFQELVVKLEERAVRLRLKEMLAFFRGIPKSQLPSIAADSRYKQLRQSMFQT